MFAKGKHAVAICQRSGEKIPYKKLVRDGYTPGLLVSPDWRDTAHPQERPVRVAEGIALRSPSPDRDIEAGGNGQSVADALFPGMPVFGGGT